MLQRKSILSSKNFAFLYISPCYFHDKNVELTREFESHGMKMNLRRKNPTQPAIKCSKSTIETLEQDVKYVQS